MPREERIINKLILIGNGFDLALGLKTSYYDFLFWYLKGLLLNSIKSEKNISDFESGEKYNYYADKLSTVFFNDKKLYLFLYK